jgi:hypothetical protein
MLGCRRYIVVKAAVRTHGAFLCSFHDPKDAKPQGEQTPIAAQWRARAGREGALR